MTARPPFAPRPRPPPQAGRTTGATGCTTRRGPCAAPTASPIRRRCWRGGPPACPAGGPATDRARRRSGLGRSLGPLPGQLLQALVVDLAGRAAADGVHDDDPTRSLVAGKGAAQVVDDLVLLDRGARVQFNKRAYRLTEPFVRQADADGVADRRMQLQHLL